MTILDTLKNKIRLKDIDALPENQKQKILQNLKERWQTLEEAWWYSSSWDTKITMWDSMKDVVRRSKNTQKKGNEKLRDAKYKYTPVQTLLEEQGYQWPTDENWKFRPVTDEDLANWWADKISYPEPEKWAVDYSKMISKAPEKTEKLEKITDDKSWIWWMSKIPVWVNNNWVDTDTASFASWVTTKPTKKKVQAPKMPDMQMMSYKTQEIEDTSTKYPWLSKQEEAEIDANPMLSEIMKESVYKDMLWKKQQDAWLQDRANIRKQYISWQATTWDKDMDNAIIAQSQAADIIRGAIIDMWGKWVWKVDDMSLLTAVSKMNPYTSNIISWMANWSIDNDLAELYLLDWEEYKAAMNLYSDFINTELNTERSEWWQEATQSENLFKNSGFFVKSLMNIVWWVVWAVEWTVWWLAELWMEWVQWVDKKLWINAIDEEQRDKAQEDVYNWFTSIIPEEMISDKDSWWYKGWELLETIFWAWKVIKGIKWLKWLSKIEKLKNANIATRVVWWGIYWAWEWAIYQWFDDLRRWELSSAEDYADMMSLSAGLWGFGWFVDWWWQKFVNSQVWKKVVSLVKWDWALKKDAIDAIEKDVKDRANNLSAENPLFKRRDAMVKELKEGIDKKITPLKNEKTVLENKLSELWWFSTEKSISSLNDAIKEKWLWKIEIQFDKNTWLYKVEWTSKKVWAKEQLNKFVDALNWSENLENAAWITDIEAITKEISKLKESNPTVSKVLTEWSSNLSKWLDWEAKEVVSKIQSLNKEMSPYLEARDRILSESENILQSVWKMEKAETPLYRDLEMMYNQKVLSKHYWKELFGTYYTQALRSPKRFKALLDMEGLPYPSIPWLYETGIASTMKWVIQKKWWLNAIGWWYAPDTNIWNVIRWTTMWYWL